MSKSFVTAALLAAACSGCTLVKPAPENNSGFSTSTGSQVSAQLVDLVDLKIYIDGQKVIDGQLTLQSGEGRFSTEFKGQAVSARCSTPPAASRAGTSCLVAVGRDSRTLRFY